MLKSTLSIKLWSISVIALLTGATSLKVHLEHESERAHSGLGRRRKISRAREAQAEELCSSLSCNEIFNFSPPWTKRMSSLITSKSSANLRARGVRAKQPLHLTRNSSSRVVHARIEIDEQPLSISFHLQGKLSDIRSGLQSVAILVFAILTLGLLGWCAFWQHEEGADDQAQKQQEKVLQSSPQFSERGIVNTLYSFGYEESSVRALVEDPWQRVAIPHSRTREDLEATVANADGSWANNYGRATGNHKEALELLFRCGIIPPQEFAHSRVGQDHIDECVWISSHMLRQRPLEEWVIMWLEAQQAFEQSVTACYSARTLERDTRKSDDEPFLSCRGTGSVPTSPQHPHQPVQRFYSEPAKRKGKASQRMAEDLMLRSRDSSGQNLLILRCREIMENARQEGAEEDTPSMTAPQAVPPSTQEPPAAPLAPSPPRVKIRAFEEVVPGSAPKLDVLEGSSAASSTFPYSRSPHA